MTARGDYPRGMSEHRSHPEFLEEASPQVAGALDALRSAASRPADEVTEARHVAAIVAAAKETAPVRVWRSGRSQGGWLMRARVWAMRACAAGSAAALSLVGLAYAGVDLPGTAAERAIEATFGVELPDQGQPTEPGRSDEAPVGNDGGDDEPSAQGGGMSDEASADDKDPGCEFGQDISEQASSGSNGRGDGAEDPCDRDGNSSSNARSGNAGSKRNGSKGGRSDDAPRAPEDAGDRGKDNAAERSDGSNDKAKNDPSSSGSDGGGSASDANDVGETARDTAGDNGKGNKTGRD